MSRDEMVTLYPRQDMAKKKAPTTTTLHCPECDGSVADADVQGKPFVICPHCAAISKMDKGLLRLLHTDEWYALMVLPHWSELMEQRARLLERLTKPSGPFAGGAPPKAT